MQPHSQFTQVPIQGLWPEALGIVSAFVYLSAIRRVAAIASDKPQRMRAVAFFGLLANLYAIYFGLLAFLLPLAVPALPAVFFFAVLIVRPQIISKWPKFRIYAMLSVALAAIYATSELLWLLHLRWKG